MLKKKIRDNFLLFYEMERGVVKVIQYDERLVFSDGGFFTPDGNIIFLSCDYENFAMTYCLGDDFDLGNCNLSKDELSILRSWEKYYLLNNICFDNMYSDFLIQLLGFDRIDSMKKTIITSNDFSDIKYNKFISNGWLIEIKPRIRYDYNSNCFLDDNIKINKILKKKLD